MQWEYTWIRLHYTEIKDKWVRVNEKGAQGWELVSAVELEGYLFLFFKRPKS